MTSRELLEKIFKEVTIRFNTDPRLYSKFDFGVLLKYIKGNSDSLDELIEEFELLGIKVDQIDSFVLELKNRIDLHDVKIASLESLDLSILQSLTLLLNSIRSINEISANLASYNTTTTNRINSLESTVGNVSSEVEEVKNVIFPIDNNFLDKRLKANSLSDLKNWNFNIYPIPEGFEVCVDGTWYTYEVERENETTGHFFKRSSGSGTGTGFGAGVPILDLSTIDELSREAIPDKYIFIPTSGDLTPKKDGESLVDGEENGLLLILFAAIKSLLALITKLLNSFDYGILSYKDKNTAMSREASESSDEPLWSIDENNLEELEEITPDLSSGTEQFSPKNKVESLGNNTLKFGSDTVTWYLDFSQYDHSKLFVYLTTEKVDSGNGRLVIIDTLSIELNSASSVSVNFGLLDLITCQKYNIFAIISRKQEVKVGNTKSLKGYNYIWISVKDYTDDTVLAEGYYNNGILSETPVYFDDRYTISLLLFKNLTLSKFKLYGKEEDFSNQVIPSEPLVSNYKNLTAHITIRSAANTDVIDSIKTQLLTDELVWSRREKKLYIIQDGEKIAIGAASSGEQSTDNMSQNELIELLKDANIVNAYLDASGNWHYTGPTPISGFTLINEDTNKKFDVTVDAYGNIKTLSLNTSDTLASKYSVAKVTPMSEKAADGTTLNYHLRGAIGQMALGNPGTGISFDKDLKLYADRIKIGAFYAPYKSDIDSKVCGCSHAYIELENTSDKDFNLDNFYLFWVDTSTASKTNPVTALKLALKGTLKAGSTYLIRGKLYAKPSDANCFINVSTYDLEWYDANGKLIDLSILTDKPYGLALLYGKDTLDSNYHLIKTITTGYTDNALGSSTPTSLSSYLYAYTTNYVDSVYYSNQTAKDNKYYQVDSAACWAPLGIYIEKNSIYRNTFELDPAKLAFLGLTTVDSSRVRNNKLDNQDAMIVRLWDKYISFPHSDYEIPVSVFTPKASFENKNVSTDKTKLEVSKPNMVTCSFGINMYTTRTFNWISCGYFDEYVWLKLGNTWVPFESYKDGDGYESTAPTYTSYPYRKEFKKTNVNTIYKRLTGTFPGDGTFFTSHKCILQLCSDAVTTPTTYTYKVGRKKANGTIDENYCSDEYTFTLYPSSYNIKLYQTTDQQGFHWVEYQVWNSVAKTLNLRIVSDTTANNIIPVLLNTGDMTLNGTRINEWLDYYNAGIDLFKHLELVNVVGNNDLCGPDPEVLGTGDDSGKSNSYYFHLFYCYEINENYIAPIIKGKYIPSLYYIDSTSHRLVCINSEITKTTCDKWYGIKSSAGNIVNAYTGYEITSSPSYVADTVGFTPIYQMVKLMFDGTIIDGTASKLLLPLCHEMPYTVITTDSLNNTLAGKYLNRVSRSLSSANKLIGSHLNLIDPSDTAALYWISRLMDWFNFKYHNCKLMLGGHKHTFTATYPVREYYYYTVNGVEKNSKDNGPMEMPASLKDDTSNFKGGTVDHLSKFPLTKVAPIKDASNNVVTSVGDTFYPYTPVEDLLYGVVYFMCQASGYKLTSNKELPSTNLKFSYILPGLSDDKAANTLKFPMFAVIDPTTSNYKILLCAVSGIMKPNMTTVLAKGSVPATPVFNLLNASNGNIKVYVYNTSKDWIRTSTATAEAKANDHTDCWQPYEDNKTFITLTVA